MRLSERVDHVVREFVEKLVSPELIEQFATDVRAIMRDCARDELLAMVAELEVRAQGSYETSKLKALAAPFQVQVIPSPAPSSSPTRIEVHGKKPDAKDPRWQENPRPASDRKSDGKAYPTCQKCGFYGGNTRGCGRSHRTLPKPAPAASDDDDEPPAAQPVVSADHGHEIAPARLHMRRDSATDQGPATSPMESSAPRGPEKLNAPPQADDASGTPCTLGTRAADEITGAGRWSKADAPRLAIDKREVCAAHGWVGNRRFNAERHDLCDGNDVSLEAETDDAELEVDTEVSGDADLDEGPTMTARMRQRRRRTEPRAATVPLKRITREMLHVENIQYRDELGQLDELRPRTRAECENGQRPCPWAGCRHNLILDVNPETGSIKMNFPDREFDELKETCALDVAARGGITLEDTATHMNLTRERIRQVEYKALMALKMNGGGTILQGQEPVVDDGN